MQVSASHYCKGLLFFQVKRDIVVSGVLQPIIKTLVKTVFDQMKLSVLFRVPSPPPTQHWYAHRSALMDSIRK